MSIESSQSLAAAATAAMIMSKTIERRVGQKLSQHARAATNRSAACRCVTSQHSSRSRSSTFIFVFVVRLKVLAAIGQQPAFFSSISGRDHLISERVQMLSNGKPLQMKHQYNMSTTSIEFTTSATAQQGRKNFQVFIVLFFFCKSVFLHTNEKIQKVLFCRFILFSLFRNDFASATRVRRNTARCYHCDRLAAGAGNHTVLAGDRFLTCVH